MRSRLTPPRFGQLASRATRPTRRSVRSRVSLSAESRRASSGVAAPEATFCSRFAVECREEALTEAMRPYARHGVHVNVDFYAGALYYLLGIPTDLFVPIFAMGRVPGWTAQVVEQMENNILIRPLADYVGPAERTYLPLDERS